MKFTLLITAASLSTMLFGAPLALAAPADEAPKKITYDDDIKPIFRQHCLTCHNQSDKRGGLAVDSYSATLAGGGSGEVVYDDGDADGSRLWQLVNHDDTPAMPPEQPKIPAEQLATLKAWIEGGILENNGSTAKVKKKNALAFVAPSSGKPEGPPPMPETLPQRVPVVTDRPAAVTAIGASPWAPLIAVAGQKQISLYHGETGELLGVLPFEEGIAQSLRFSRDGRFLIAGGGQHSVLGIAVVYDIQNGTRVASVGDELDIVFDADCNDNMSRIALGGPQRMLRIFDATDGTLLFDLKKHTDWIYAVAFSPDGVLVASADRAGGLVIWEADTGRQFLDLVDHKGAVNSISWRDDSNVLASASDDGTVKLWDVVQGTAIKSIAVGGGAVNAVRFDHQGQLITASSDHKVRLFDAAGTQIKEFPAMAEAALETAFTHDSSRVVYGDWTGAVQLTTIADPPVVTPLATNPPPAAERLKAVEATLVSMQTQLAPLAAAQAAAKAILDATQLQLQEAEAAHAAGVAALQASQAKEAALRQQSQQLGEKLPAMILQSRDQHDAVIAARIGLGVAVDAAMIEVVAIAETNLATLMTEIAGTRRQAVDAFNQAQAETAAAVDLTAKIKPAEDLLVLKRGELAAAQTAWEQAQQAHDVVAAQMSEQDRKKQALAEAIQ